MSTGLDSLDEIGSLSLDGPNYAMKYRDDWVAKHPEDFKGYKNRWRGRGSQILNMRDMINEWFAGKEFSDENKAEYMEYHRQYRVLYPKSR